MWIFVLYMLNTCCALKNTLFEECNIKKAIEMEPASPEEHVIKYFVQKRFTSDTVKGISYLMSTPAKNSHLGMLLMARNAKKGGFFNISTRTQAEMFWKICESIAKKYYENCYEFRVFKQDSQAKTQIKDILITIWSMNKAIITKFYYYVGINKIYVEDVIEELEYLAKHGNPVAFGILGDVYLYGLIGEQDIDRAMEYYLAGKELKDFRSILGIVRVMLKQPGTSTSEIISQLNSVMGMAKDNPEANYLYGKLLLEDKSNMSAILEAGIYVQKAAMSGYLPAIFKMAESYHRRGMIDIAIRMYMNITEYDSNILKYTRNAEEAYGRREYGKALLYFLFLSEFNISQGTKRAIEVLEAHRNVIENSEALLFSLYMERATTSKKYYKKIGDCYYYGIGVERSMKSAVAYYTSSLPYSDEGRYNLGYMYENGVGVKKDLYLAYRYMSMSPTSDYNYLAFFYAKLRIVSRILVRKMYMPMLMAGLGLASLYVIRTKFF